MMIFFIIQTKCRRLKKNTIKKLILYNQNFFDRISMSTEKQYRLRTGNSVFVFCKIFFHCGTQVHFGFLSFFSNFHYSLLLLFFSLSLIFLSFLLDIHVWNSVIRLKSFYLTFKIVLQSPRFMTHIFRPFKINWLQK